MSLISNLIARPATDLVNAVGNVFDKLFTSDDERAQAQIVLERLKQYPDILQAEINMLEAQHRSVFVAGWRPFIGWVCGFGFLWAFIGHPLFEWVVAVNGSVIQAPTIMTDNLMELVLAMLGLGGLRTVEKLKGRAR